MSPLIFDDLRISLSAIREGVNDFSFEASAPQIEKDEARRFDGTIDVAVRVTRMGEDYLLDLKANGEASFVCDRCGEDFTRKVEGRIRTLLTFDTDKAGDEEDDDVRLLPASVHEIDLRGDVIDALVLAIPAKLLCRESCKGLCSQCGANLNENPCQCEDQPVDSRWEGLKKLKFDE